MDRKLDCDIVRDLLPSYVDKLTGETTNKAIEEHLAGCEGCSEALRQMKEPEAKTAAPAPEVDYLKKVRRGTAKVGMICGIVMMLIGMLIILFRVFYIGNEAQASEVYCSAAVEDGSVYLGGTLTSSAQGVARVVFEENAGIVRVRIYTAPFAFFNSGDFTASYEAAGPVDMVCIDDIPIWYEGSEIARTAGRLFAEKNPFVGDMPQNGRIASVLGISDQLGSYTNELQTETEPYGWALLLDEPIAAEDEHAAKAIMASDSYVLLALVDNLGYVEWRYSVGDNERSYTVTAEAASEFAGQDIKLCGESPVELQELMSGLDTKWSGMPSIGQETGSFRLKFSNYCDGEIYGLSLNYYLDGKLIGSVGVQDGGGSASNKGDDAYFQFIPKDFPKGTNAVDLSGFSFDLYAVDKDGNQVEVCKDMKVPAKYAWTFFYSLTGSFETGITLSEG